MQLEKHKDKRGVIEDLYVGKDFSVTRITFKKGAVRGNHKHLRTTQIDILKKGKLKSFAKGQYFMLYGNKTGFFESGILNPKQAILHPPKMGHAYKALKDSEMISICIGKRIGKNYSKDTYKLETPLV